MFIRPFRGDREAAAAERADEILKDADLLVAVSHCSAGTSPDGGSTKVALSN